MSRHRILLVEDHALVRAGLRALLDALSAVQVIGEAADGSTALEMIAELAPDLVVLEVALPGLNGIEVIARAARLRPRPRILAISVHAERDYGRAARAAGAAGYLTGHASAGELRQAIAAIANGETWHPAGARPLAGPPANGLSEARATLTPRQREVLQLLAEGLSTRQIARQLRISIKTVEAHRAQIMERLQIHTVAGLVRYALRAGIVEDG